MFHIFGLLLFLFLSWKHISYKDYKAETAFDKWLSVECSFSKSEDATANKNAASVVLLKFGLWDVCLDLMQTGFQFKDEG